jgi:hypothetical protein
MVRSLALAIQLGPRLVTGLVLLNHRHHPGAIRRFAIAGLCLARTSICAGLVAPQEVGAKALLTWALLRLPTDDEGVESTATLGHVDVQTLHLFAALNMPMMEFLALVIHIMATTNGLCVLVNASTKAILCEAIHVLLILLVCLFESLLDVCDEHGADGLQSVLDVLVKLPARFRNGFLDQTLDKGLHLRGIAMSHSGKEAVRSRRRIQSDHRGQEQRCELHVNCLSTQRSIAINGK